MLSNNGAAFCIEEDECDSNLLAQKITDILSNDKMANKLSNNAKNMSVPEASLNLKEFVLMIFHGEMVEFKN